ncbi:NAD(P)H-binding protein [Sulfitobacter sp. D35]|uniref:NAD(P)-dependent oxidoreductase n=1 Tax=Sulfitobacter sp. D35 TaxID=3083252 RepID=UPI00296E6968|nr:NAD(P)H-binding protein [Sulfitobacter sp. D35]MDW4500237.1 NAD(P)H-binding protein [Sulfitobacter sp. D35]
MTTETNAEIETIAVFGATGKTGRHVVRHALDRGYKVRALARRPEQLAIPDERLTVIKGDFEDIPALADTVNGAAYVICCAGGPSGKHYEPGMMIAFIRRLWPLLDAQPVLRVFLFQSVIFAPDTDGKLPTWLKILAPAAAYLSGNTQMLKDNTAVTQFIGASSPRSFNTIVTRPGAIAEKPGGVALRADQKNGSLSPITFADLGAFTVDSLKNSSLYETCPFIVPAR